LKDINDSEQYPKQLGNVTVIGHIDVLAKTSNQADKNSYFAAH
jgi:hypothetical protein